MGKYKANPRYCVISLRVSEEEQRLLALFAVRRRQNLSEAARDAILQAVGRIPDTVVSRARIEGGR